MEEMVEIYRKYMPQVYKFLFSLCCDAHLSEELTQETFFQAIKSIDSFRGDCKIYVWLCLIAKHLWYKELKKKDREVVAEYVEEADCQKATENSAIQKMEVIELYKKLHLLEEPVREVMYARNIWKNDKSEVCWEGKIDTNGKPCKWVLEFKDRTIVIENGELVDEKIK